jgi:hypothetical protein
MRYDRVDFQAKMAKKPGDERRGRGKLLLGQRQPRIVWAKLAKMQDATAEDRAAVNRRQVAIAKRALGE